MTVQAQRNYEKLTDLELAGCLSRKESLAVRLVTKRNNQRLFRAAWSILKNRAEAEDVVQEAYFNAVQAIQEFKGQSSLSTWLTRITINEALKRKRASARRATALAANSVLVLDEYREKLMGSLERSSSPEASVMRKQLAKLLENTVAQLPESFRVVFVLREVEGLSVEETADVLQIPPQTVKTRFLRARRRLQQMLDPELRSAFGEVFPFAGADCEALTLRILKRLGLSSRTNQGETT